MSQRATELKAREEAAGFTKLESYLTFTEKVQETKRKLLEFLIGAKRAGKSVVGLRRRRQRRDPVELLRRANRFHRLCRRSQPAQARPLYAGRAHPDFSSG